MNGLTAKTREQMNHQVVFEDYSIYLKEKVKKKLEKFPGSFGINQHISSRMSWLVVGLFLFLDSKSKFT